jgi:hypothetical protein
LDNGLERFLKHDTEYEGTLAGVDAAIFIGGPSLGFDALTSQLQTCWLFKPIFSILLMLLAQPAAAACLNLASGAAPVSLEGKLSLEVFPGPPNYESVANGDAAEPAWLLLLDKKICIEDGGQFADSSHHFDSVHVYSADTRVQARFEALSGKRVTLKGSGFPAHTGHHHAPLVVDVSAIAQD